MIRGAEGFIVRLRGRIAGAEASIDECLAQLAAETTALARELAPEGAPPRREPRLKDSFYTEAGHLRAVTRVTNPHAAYVEFGTGRRGAESGGRGNGYDAEWSGMSAQPYMYPAAQAAREVFRDRLIKAFRDGGGGKTDDNASG